MNIIKIVNTGKSELLLLKVPKSANYFNTKAETGRHAKIWRVVGYPSVHSILSAEFLSEPLPEGNWQILGLTIDLTEDQCMQVVPDRPAMKFFYSLLLSHKCYNDNPYGDKLMRFNTYESVHKISGAPHTPYGEYKDAWQESENHTGSWLVLKRQ